ncbi:hypothetical protein POVWA2_055630 [Plasmodium ovale wallikeri]|uniref:Uncharacterized protein n=1 Tax=Plasmodium ovale wallikeri TaxID=864142 RepID=A0A1A8ZWG6_PLAOA|nr:hypothetical protein POVWA1_056250 [Plasmodium ovale wallikeri]SBT48257.1 hypothetical protein POVWA2_055630 [Plasmodium ovale wallikeri]
MEVSGGAYTDIHLFAYTFVRGRRRWIPLNIGVSISRRYYIELERQKKKKKIAFIGMRDSSFQHGCSIGKRHVFPILMRKKDKV